MSQLKVQPPLGVTVPDIADWLSAYFGSLEAGGARQGEEEGEEEGVEVEEEEEEEVEEEEDEEEEFCLEEEWAGEEEEMRKMFVYCQLGGMERALLRSTWAASLNTTDQEKERVLNRLEHHVGIA